MTTIQIGRFGKAHIWANEASGAIYKPSSEMCRSVEPGTLQPSLKNVAIEATVPRGARSEYGLLGVTIASGATCESLKLEVPWSNTVGNEWRSSIVGSTESAYIGLPKEYAAAVLDGLDCAAKGTISPGTVRVTESVHGLIGSSPDFMGKLARIAIRIALLNDHSEIAFRNELMSILLG